MTKKYTFQPDYGVRPGATLKEAIEDRGMSQSELAARTGITEKTISQIINGVAPISCNTADKLELVLGISAGFWNRRELGYRQVVTRQEETAKLAADIAWLDEIPLRALVAQNYIERTNEKTLLVRRALSFFGVSSVDAWRNFVGNLSTQFRGKEVHKRKPGYVAAWRRIGVLRAQAIDTQPFDGEEFKRALRDVRKLLLRPARVWVEEVSSRCADAGVAVVFTKAITGASVSGLARWVKKDKALIQLSLKYKTEDQLWFTFFHEAGHILLHGKKQIFVDDGISDEGVEEREANKFSRNLLIPPEFAHRLPHLKSRVKVKAFAKEIGVTPGIVVGRLQNEDFLRRNAMNDLKIKLDFV